MSSSSATTRQGAARLTRGAQVATIALAGLAAAALVFGIPGTGTETVELEPVELAPLTRQQAVEQVQGPDVRAVADRFATIANAPKAPTPPPTSTDAMSNPGAIAPPPPPPPPDNIKYLGHVGLGATLFAMINENQRQTVVGLNDELSSGRVVEITPQSLTLEQNGARKVIELAARSGSAISTVLPMGAGNRGIRGSGTRAPLSPEDIMARTRPAPQPQGVVFTAADQMREQVYQDHFNTAVNRLQESGLYKDESELKQVADRYANEMARIEQDIMNGDDPEKIEWRRKELDESVFQGSPK